MAKRTGSRHELKRIKKIKSKASNNNSYSNIDNYIGASNSDSSLSSDSEWDKRRHPTECKEIDKLDHVVTNNITNKYQRNDTICRTLALNVSSYTDCIKLHAEGG